MLTSALKDFGHEQLPFKKFNPNTAWHYTMLLGHFLLESFKADVANPIVSATSYTTTVRRKLIDIAGKIVRHAGKVILKVTVSSFEELKPQILFDGFVTSPNLDFWPQHTVVQCVI